MIPLGTVNNPTKNTPYLTYGLILVNIAFFIWQLTLPTTTLDETYSALAVVPCQFPANVGPGMIVSFLRGMFLHVGWAHLIGNMTFLWLFGTNVEDYFGRRTFLLLYFLGGILAGLTQTIVYAYMCSPLVGIGASGAISAVLGAYLILYPGTKVRVGILFFRFFLYQTTVPALVMLGLWFVIQVFSGVAALSAGTSGGIGFFAHIGGFVFGMIFAFVYTLFRRAPDAIVS